MPHPARSVLAALRRRLPARPRARLEALFWLAFATFFAWRVWPQVAAALGVASARTVAPDFRVTTLDGVEVTRDALRGQVVLVNVWATWCGPCRVEMPGFQDVYDRYRARGFTILGVSTDAAGEAHVQRYVQGEGITYPIAMASGGIVRAFGGVRGIPTSFLVDRQGRIRHTVTGIFTEVALAQAVERLLAEPASDAGAPDPTSAPPATPPPRGAQYGPQ